jgi:hypothetical protein
MRHIGTAPPSWRIAAPSEKQNCFHPAMKGSKARRVEIGNVVAAGCFAGERNGNAPPIRD